MTPDPEESEAEIASLERLIRSREGKGGFTENVAELKARLAELKGEPPADG